MFFFRFILTLTLLISSTQLLANSLEGRIQKFPNGSYIYLENDPQLYKLFTADQSVASEFARLQTGDFLSLDAKIHFENQTVYVRGINFVGLQRLLGRWIDPQNSVYSFLDFSTLRLRSRHYNPFRRRMDRQINYTLTPDTGDTWSIFMVEQGRVEVGTLRFLSQDHLEMKIVDAESGQYYPTVELRNSSRR